MLTDEQFGNQMNWVLKAWIIHMFLFKGSYTDQMVKNRRKMEQKDTKEDIGKDEEQANVVNQYENV